MFLVLCDSQEVCAIVAKRESSSLKLRVHHQKDLYEIVGGAYSHWLRLRQQRRQPCRLAVAMVKHAFSADAQKARAEKRQALGPLKDLPIGPKIQVQYDEAVAKPCLWMNSNHYTKRPQTEKAVHKLASFCLSHLGTDEENSTMLEALWQALNTKTLGAR